MAVKTLSTPVAIIVRVQSAEMAHPPLISWHISFVPPCTLNMTEEPISKVQ